MIDIWIKLLLNYQHCKSSFCLSVPVPFLWLVSYLRHEFREVESALFVLSSFSKFLVYNSHKINKRYYLRHINRTLYKNMILKCLVNKKSIPEINKYLKINVMYPVKEFSHNRQKWDNYKIKLIIRLLIFYHNY